MHSSSHLSMTYAECPMSHPQRSKQRGANITVFKCWSAYFRWLSTAAVFLWLYNHEGCLTRLSPANDSWQRLDDLLRLFMIARPILTFTGDPHTPPNHHHPTAPLRIRYPPAGLSICCFSTFQAPISIWVLLETQRFISFIAFHTTVQSSSAVSLCRLISLLP